MLSNDVPGLFEVFAHRMPQLGQNGLQLVRVLRFDSLGTQLAYSPFKRYIECHKAPVRFNYLNPSVRSIPYLLYDDGLVTKRAYSIHCIARARCARYSYQRTVHGRSWVSVSGRSFFIRPDIRILTTGPPTYSPNFSGRTIPQRPAFFHYTATYFRRSCDFCQWPF